MSLVPSFVKADNNKWYDGPILGGPKHKSPVDWYICFDDDDPVELVVRSSLFKDKIISDVINQILTDNNLPFICKKPKCQGSSQRHFPIPGSKNGKFIDAKSFWLEMTGPIPVDKIVEYDKVYDSRPKFEGVYYGGN